MVKVFQANPYRPHALGSLGDGAYLLIRQFNFPNEYDETLDKHMFADHDRCFQWDYNHARRCFTEHTGTGELAFENWAASANHEAVIQFLVDILKAERLIKWTGFRILGTVNQSNGYPVWSLELFCKHPDSKTKLYTGENAPNVKGGERKKTLWGGYIILDAGGIDCEEEENA